MPQPSVLKTSLLAFLAFTACAPTEPPPALPEGAVAISPPASYAAWYAATEQCSGLQGSLDAIEWYVVPEVTAFATDRGDQVAMWEREGTRHLIVIAGAYQDSEMVVRHEVLHALLGQSGHPRAYFEDRCHLTWETWPGA